MALSSGNLALASDMATFISTVNTTLTKYGITNITNSATQGTQIFASLINSVVTNLLTADASSSNTSPNTEQTTLNSNKVSIGDLIRAANITNIQTCATNIINRYCSCNCNNCSCNCNRCSCNCDRCSCASNTCSCNCDRYCTIGSAYVCFLPDSYIITSKGAKKVQEITVGDFVLGLNGSFDEVVSAWSADIKNETVVNYSNDSLDLSMTQPHLFPGKENNTVHYPILQPSAELPTFRAGILYPQKLLDNIILFGSHLLSVDKTSTTFKKSQKIVDICKEICTLNSFSVIMNQDNTMTILGKEKQGNYYLAQMLRCFVQENNKITFPSFIYNFSHDLILKLKQQVDTGIEFNSLDQCVQIQFLLNCHGFNYKRENRHLIFIKELINNSNPVNVKQLDNYNGSVYNFVCRFNHIVAGEVLVGDGYVR